MALRLPAFKDGSAPKDSAQHKTPAQADQAEQVGDWHFVKHDSPSRLSIEGADKVVMKV